MKELLLLLTLPLLSGIALAVDHHARTGATRDEQPMLTSILRLLACALAAVGLTMVVDAIVAGMAGPRPVLHVAWMAWSALLVIGLLATVGGVLAEWAARPRPGRTATQRARADRNMALFRLCCWTFVLAPLLGFCPPLAVGIPTILVIYMGWTGAERRSMEAGLLARLATAAANGLPLAEEAQTAGMGYRGRRRDAFFGLADRIRDGRTLANSLEVGTRLVPRSAILAIQAADASDATPEVLQQQADRSLRDLEDFSLPGNSMIFQSYIAAVVMVLSVIVIWLTIKVIPRQKMLYQDFGIEVPPLTQMLFAAADHPEAIWFYSGPLFLIPLGILMLPALLRLVGWENLNLPLLMRWFPRRDGPAVLRALAAAVEANRPLPEAVAVLAEHHHREDMRQRLQRIAVSMEQGEWSWMTVSREGFINRSEAQALDAAMTAGHLGWALNSMADVLAHRQSLRSAWWMEWQRPLLIGIVGGAVGFLAIAFFLPLIRLFERLDGQV